MWKAGMLALALGAAVGTAAADGSPGAGPVVVELYTSQGCNSCPPADAFLEELAGRADVIALSLHVDYWNYLGWADTFAAPEHAKRQKRFARAMGERMIYTPQMIVDGRVGLVGSDRAAVEAAIVEARAHVDVVAVTISPEGGMLRARLSASPGVAADLYYLVYDHAREVDVDRGENGGRTLRSANIVRALMPLGTLPDGGADLTLPAPSDAKGAVVLAQDARGRIIGAGRIEFPLVAAARP